MFKAYDNFGMQDIYLNCTDLANSTRFAKHVQI